MLVISVLKGIQIPRISANNCKTFSAGHCKVLIIIIIIIILIICSCYLKHSENTLWTFSFVCGCNLKHS